MAAALSRSEQMARIKGRDTKPELLLRRRLHSLGMRYRVHLRTPQGRADVVFCRAKLAVFVDGSFWHGWRFPLWEHKLAPKWQDKIRQKCQC